MSVIPFTTQMGSHNPNTQGSSKSLLKVVLVYTDKMTERQSALMRECQDYLCQSIGILIKKANEIDSLPHKMRHFVVPSLNSSPKLKDDLVKKIRNRFEKPIIYLPRAVIESRGYYRVNLPVRNLAISLTMFKCRIFLVQRCDVQSIRNKINEMCGSVIPSFQDDDLNVVITDTADNRYCSRAFKRNIPVVSRNWVDENYMVASEEESSFFNQDAMTAIGEHQIKPFFGLHFKIMADTPGAQIKKLITDNQGHIIYGNENCLTHIVAPPDYDLPDGDEQSDSANKSSSHKPRIVDEEFLRVCVESGHFMTKREYDQYKITSNIPAKQEQRSQPHQISQQISQQISVHVEENHIPQAANRYNSGTSENQAMRLPPPQVPCPPVRQPPDNMNDMILKALSTFETAQTQLASTQMRRLPDPELRIEQTFEPSQQIYWNDSVSRRN